MPIKSNKKCYTKIVLLTIVASIVLLPIVYTMQVKPIEEIATTNYANAETLGTIENVSSGVMFLPEVNGTKNLTLTDIINQENASNLTRMKTVLDNIAGLNQIYDKNQTGPLFNFTNSTISSSSTAGALTSSGTTGDFNGDGFADKAISVIGEDVNGVVDAGAVQVVYGSSGGLSAVSAIQDQLWTQGSPDVQGDLEAGNYFGWSLSSGDYNGDGYDDLVIGVPLENIDLAVATLENFDANINSNLFDPYGNVGVVQVLYGSTQGLSPTAVLPDQVLMQGFGGLKNNAEPYDYFGWTLSSGDFNADGKDDLVVGILGDESGRWPFDRRGAVQVVFGSNEGLSANVLQDQLITPAFEGLEFEYYGVQSFGEAVSSGDFNGDTFDDLAIGAPGANLDTGNIDEYVSFSGKVTVLYGSQSGLSATSPVPHQVFYQGIDGIEDVAETYDDFGWPLSSGDYNGDGYDDLAIGAPGESIQGGTIKEVGKIHVVYGSASGLSTTSPLADQLWEQGVRGLDDVAEEEDWFGSSLSSGDYNGDGKDDLAIGVGLEDVNGGTVDDAGKVQVIYGSASGLSTTSPLADQIFEQGQNSLDDTTQEGDGFGSNFS
jgi:FG-GAP repeat protein